MDAGLNLPRVRQRFARAPHDAARLRGWAFACAVLVSRALARADFCAFSAFSAFSVGAPCAPRAAPCLLCARLRFSTSTKSTTFDFGAVRFAAFGAGAPAA